MPNPVTLTEEEIVALLDELENVSHKAIFDASLNGRRREIRERLVTVLQSREERVCEWTDTGNDNPMGLDFFRKQCDGQSIIKIGNYCPDCGGRIKETPSPKEKD